MCNSKSGFEMLIFVMCISLWNIILVDLELGHRCEFYCMQRDSSWALNGHVYNKSIAILKIVIDVPNINADGFFFSN